MTLPEASSTYSQILRSVLGYRLSERIKERKHGVMGVVLEAGEDEGGGGAGASGEWGHCELLCEYRLWFGGGEDRVLKGGSIDRGRENKCSNHQRDFL